MSEQPTKRTAMPVAWSDIETIIRDWSDAHEMFNRKQRVYHIDENDMEGLCRHVAKLINAKAEQVARVTEKAA